jgi:glycosyltransferase involved in cell wall biosynthesis
MDSEVVEISLIVPVYNVEAYVVRCIDSVMAQTYPPLECIIVDDGSTDNSRALLLQHLESYSGPIAFRVFHHDCNRGLSEARNTGIANARGRYLFFLDSDDELPPSGFEDLAHMVLKYPEIEMVVGNMHTLPAPASTIDLPHIAGKHFPEYSDDNDWMQRRFYRHRHPIPVNACGKLVKRRFLVDQHLLFRPGIIHEDVLWMFFVLRKLQTIGFCEKDSYIRHVRAGSIMQSTDAGRRLKSWLTILQEIFDCPAAAYSNLRRRKYYRVLFQQMATIDLHSEVSAFYPLYRKMVRSLLKKSLFRQPLILTIALLILLMPQAVYRTWVVRKTFGLCVKLSILGTNGNFLLYIVPNTNVSIVQLSSVLPS